MDHFLFFVSVRSLPIYSTCFGISNYLLTLYCGIIQLIASIFLLTYFKFNASILFIISSGLILIYCSIYRLSKFGFVCYFVQLISSTLVYVFWFKKVIIGLDTTIHNFKQGFYTKVATEVIIDYLLTGVLTSFTILILFVVFSYSNELHFEEVKAREEHRSECESNRDTESDSLFSHPFHNIMTLNSNN